MSRFSCSLSMSSSGTCSRARLAYSLSINVCAHCLRLPLLLRSDPLGHAGAGVFGAPELARARRSCTYRSASRPAAVAAPYRPYGAGSSRLVVGQSVGSLGLGAATRGHLYPRTC